MPDVLEEFDELAILSYVTSLTNNYISIQDLTLSEFLIDLSRKSCSVEEFKKNLADQDITTLPEELVLSIFSYLHKTNLRNEPKGNTFKENGSSLRGDRFTDQHSKRSRWYHSEQYERSPYSDSFSHPKNSSPEHWELKQLMASGAMPGMVQNSLGQQNHRSFSSLNQSHPIDPAASSLDESEFNVQLNKHEPSFLKGQTKIAAQISPVRVVRNPQGSLLRAAQTSSSLLQQQNTSNNNSASVASLNQEKTNEPLPLPQLSDSSVQLPIERYAQEIVELVSSNQVLVIVGETGSGKTTKIPQYLNSAGFNDTNKSTSGHSQLCIACTQPRRVAATSVAKRVAREMGCKLGTKVGYTIRFDDCSSPSTRIRYMTDGMLLRECLTDPQMTRYSVIMLDEAHERTLNTDVLFGLLKQAIQKRPSLRLIVTSATLECDRFSRYFSNCPVFKIPGRTFPVEVMYTKEAELDYLQAAIQTTLQIHRTESSGDILLFLTGQEEIETACEMLQQSNRDSSMCILPLYASMPSTQQSLVFEPVPKEVRKIVVGTNIAETSLTIPGIRFVVDTGMCKQKVYNPRLGMDSLQVTPISQAQALQRSGRAGRTGPGKCYRLYTERAYHEEMLTSGIPEVQRTCLTNTLLQLKSMGIQDLLTFPWMDAPPLQAVVAALHQLFALGALDDDGMVTRLGRQMAQLPLDPPLAKTLLHGASEDCLDEILTVVAMLSTQLSLFYRPRGREEEADRVKTRFSNQSGDHLTLLNVYEQWERNGCSPQWCWQHFLHSRALLRAREIRTQLTDMLHRLPLPPPNNSPVDLKWRVQRSILAGFFMHVAQRDSHDGGYRTLLDRTSVYVHPSSALFGKEGGRNDWVVYHELVCTSREWMREISVIDPRWLIELAPGYYRSSNDSQDTRLKGLKLKPIGGKEDWRPSKRRPVHVSQRF